MALRGSWQESIKDPARFPWHEVNKVAHDRLEMDAMVQPMQMGKDVTPCRGNV